LNIVGALPTGSYVLAYLNVIDNTCRNYTSSDKCGSTIATANSGALFEAGAVGVPGPIAGAGLPGVLLASVSLMAWWRSRRRHSAAI
jgi:hypothetical protein